MMTRKFSFDAFMKYLPKDGPGEPMPAASVEKYANRVPTELPDFWTTHGLGSFGNKALWFIDPGHIIEEAHRLDLSTDAIPFARTAFGDIFSVLDGAVVFTLPQSNRTEPSAPTLDIWGFGTFRSEEKNAGIFSLELKSKLEAELGPIDKDTCYGLKLALALGGDERLDNFAISNLQVYLDILGSLHQ